MSDTVTDDMEAANKALTDWLAADGAAFSEHWHVSESAYEWSLHSIVSLEFEACAVANRADKDWPDILSRVQYRPSIADDGLTMDTLRAYVAVSESIDEPWEASLEDMAIAGDQAHNVSCLYQDYSTIGELIYGYLAIVDADGEARADELLTEYLAKLDAIDRAMRAAGWEL